MKVTQSLWLSTTEVCSLEQVLELSGLPRSVFDALVDAGLIEPASPGPASAERVFRTDCIVLARQARRLRDDFELDEQGLTLAMALLARIRDLEARLETLSARHPAA